MTISLHFTSAIPDSESFPLEFQVSQQQRPLPWPRYRPESHSFAPFLLQIQSSPQDLELREKGLGALNWREGRWDKGKPGLQHYIHIWKESSTMTNFTGKLLSFLQFSLFVLFILMQMLFMVVKKRRESEEIFKRFRILLNRRRQIVTVSIFFSSCPEKPELRKEIREKSEIRICKIYDRLHLNKLRINYTLRD